MQAYDDGRVKASEADQDISERAGGTVFATSQASSVAQSLLLTSELYTQC